MRKAVVFFKFPEVYISRRMTEGTLLDFYNDDISDFESKTLLYTTEESLIRHYLYTFVHLYNLMVVRWCRHRSRYISPP